MTKTFKIAANGNLMGECKGADERAARRERINQLERQLISDRHTIERVKHYLDRPSERSHPYSERIARESIRQAIERRTVAELELARLRS